MRGGEILVAGEKHVDWVMGFWRNTVAGFHMVNGKTAQDNETTHKARNLLDAEPKALGRLIGAVQKVARAVQIALKPDGVVVTQFNGAAAGQTVFHLHFHVIPRYEGVALGRHGTDMADVEELKATNDDLLARSNDAMTAGRRSTDKVARPGNPSDPALLRMRA